MLFRSLSGERISPLYLGDENTATSKNGSIEGDFDFWKDKFLTNIKKRNEKEDVKEVEEEEYESEEEVTYLVLIFTCLQCSLGT